MDNPLASPQTWDLVAGAYLEETVPVFARFAAEALRLAGVRAGDRVLDVACGPGTLALIAAPAVARVDALDFSPAMIELLVAGAPANVFARVGDGQALPYEDASFDAAFSLFGLIFFPDRAAGLSELRRVLKPGGRAVISSWPASEQAPFVDIIFQAMREQTSAPPVKQALAEPAEYDAELGAAGFRDVRIERVAAVITAPSLDALWASFARSMAPLVILRRTLGQARWAVLAGTIVERLRSRFGSGEQCVELPAWIGVGASSGRP